MRTFFQFCYAFGNYQTISLKAVSREVVKREFMESYRRQNFLELSNKGKVYCIKGK